VQQRDVGVDLVGRGGRAVADPLQVEEPAGDRRADGRHPEWTENRRPGQVHAPDPPEMGNVDQGVEDGERLDAVAVSQRPLEADGAADVVQDEVAAIDAERFDRIAGPAAQPRPAVVEGAGLRGQAQARQIEGHAAQPALRQQWEHLAIEEGAHRDTVHEHDRIAVALLPDEAPNAAGLELAAGAPMLLDCVRNLRLHDPGSSHLAATLARQAPLTRSCEARKEQQ
jgi:hypothetical protein